MNFRSSPSRRGIAAAIAAAILIAVGAGTTYLVMRSRWGARTAGDATGMPGMDAASRVTPSQPGGLVPDAPLPDVVVTLPEDLVRRAGIVIARATTGATSSVLRLPGIVQPNAYRQVEVTPLVAGRVVRVLADLGQRVRQGQTLAQLFSPELAEAQTRFAGARAELEALDRELRRTQKLVEIGAASRQELERVQAAHTAKTASVQSAESRLRLLGMSAAAIRALAAGKAVATIAAVPAPIGGTVTARTANVGLNVEPAMTLFTIVDLSTVWVVADLHEKDFGGARIGSFAAVTAPAYPGLVLRGRITYIDPQVSPDTRTAKVRVEVPNANGQLRLGMYLDVAIETPGDTPVVLIPRGAVQNVGGRTVVYLATPGQPGRFVEREVRLGEAIGDRVEVLGGVAANDSIVAKGSFFLRAERERLGLRAAASAPAPAPQSQTAKVIVTAAGFEPARVVLSPGRPATITFVRTSDQSCATEVVFPSLGIKRALPLNTPVTIALPAPASGEIAFACGMDMLRGTVVIR